MLLLQLKMGLSQLLLIRHRDDYRVVLKQIHLFEACFYLFKRKKLIETIALVWTLSKLLFSVASLLLKPIYTSL